MHWYYLVQVFIAVIRIVVVFSILWIRVAYASANISAVLDILSVFVVVQLSLKIMDICILYTQ